MKEYFAFQWHITDECDQRCKHCYIFSENNCKHLDAMTWEQIQETFATKISSEGVNLDKQAFNAS